MSLHELLKQNEELERKAVLDLDAIMHKVTQEVSEVLELLLDPDNVDLPHLIEEVGDSLTNILSVQWRLGNQEIPEPEQGLRWAPLDIVVAHGKRNDLVQKHRGIYARSRVSIETVTTATAHLCGQLLALVERTGTPATLASLCQPTIQKFIDRSEAYGPHIDLKDHIRDVQDYPKPGILFKDITPLLKHPRAYTYTIQELCERVKDADVIVWLDARGFIFGGAVAEKLGKPFVPIRKKGKLPYTTIEDSYALEYGEAVQTMHIDALQSGQKVAIIDDLLATGGTVASAIRLIEQGWGIVAGCYFVIGLNIPWADSITGRERIKDYKVETLVDY